MSIKVKKVLHKNMHGGKSDEVEVIVTADEKYLQLVIDTINNPNAPNLYGGPGSSWKGLPTATFYNGWVLVSREKSRGGVVYDPFDKNNIWVGLYDSKADVDRTYGVNPSFKSDSNLNEERKKKKNITLPPLITSVLPDKETGVEMFNNSCDVDVSAVSVAEALRKMDYDDLRQEIVDATLEFMVMQGFPEDDARAYTAFSFENQHDRFRCEVRAELSFDSMDRLASILNPIVKKYDPDAYFDMVDAGIMDAYIYKEDSSLEESFNRIDKQSFYNGIYSDLTGLYESTQAKLSASDKDKLAKFVKNNEDVGEIETYIQGLLNKKEESLKEDMNTDLQDELHDHINECDGNIYEELPEWLQLYLEEFDAPWVHYGKLPSGIYFYVDDYDEIFFNDLTEFIEDYRYNFGELRKEYMKDPDAYDFSPQFVELLTASNWKKRIQGE